MTDTEFAGCAVPAYGGGKCGARKEVNGRAVTAYCSNECRKADRAAWAERVWRDYHARQEAT